jgi:hypothetical protein
MFSSKTLAAVAVASIFAGSAQAATFTWTGGNGATPWHNAANWAGASVPTVDGSSLGTGANGVVVFDSETAVSGYMPTDTITVDNDWTSSGGKGLTPAIQLLNGTLNLAGPGGQWWHWGGGNVYQVGDGDTGTLAQLNSSFNNWTRHFDSGGPNKITVNADGTFNQTANFTFSSGGSNDAQLTLNGGTFISSGTVTGLDSGDADDFVSFEALGSSFTAVYGGDFTTVADVNNAVTAGVHFKDTTGNGLVVTDNGGSFTITVIPEPASLAMGLVGLTLIAARRRR